MSNVKELTTSDFTGSVASHKGVAVVDFWATWCGYCTQMAPVYAALSSQLGDQVFFGKVDSDAEPELVQQYEVEVLPTFLIFKDGRVVDRKIGAMPLETLKQAVLAHV